MVKIAPPIFNSTLRDCLLGFTLTISAAAIAADTSEWRSPLLQDHPLVGKIYDLHQQAFIGEDQLLERLQNVKIILIGEQHDNPDHHRIEQDLLESLLSTDSSQTVFEMLKTDQQSAASTLKTEQSLDDIKAALNWDDKGWPWVDYIPLIQSSLSQGANITAGNLDTVQLKRIYNGIPNTEFDSLYPSASLVAQQARDAILDQIYESHCQSMQKASLKPMLEIQMARDAQMAVSLTRGQKSLSILIAGGFHTHKEYGVPVHLAYYTQETAKVILLNSVSEGLNSPNDYGNLTKADFMWFTPKPETEDYCSKFKQKTQ